MTVIQYQKGDIFDSTAQVIVNTVNCKGVMGKGLALFFKQRYPAMFTTYQQECRTGKLRIGRPTLYRASTHWILNFPTKDDWRLPSKLEYLEKGLEYVVANYKEEGIKSIAFPKLGAQNGKLSWDDVGPLMAKYLSQLDIDVNIYIAEGDMEYQHDSQCKSDAEGDFWKQFNELTRSVEGLRQEIRISEKGAKQIVDKRKSMAFTSLAEIESIDGLAESYQARIKAYINRQLVTKDVAKSPKQKRKKRNTRIEVSMEPLFPEKELVS